MRRYTEQINGKWVITAERDNTIAVSGDGNKLKSVSGASIDHFAELEDKIERGEIVPAAEDENARHRAEVAERALVIMAEKVVEYAEKANVTAMTSDGLFSCDKNAQLALLVNDALRKAEQKMTEEEKEGRR